MKNLVNFFMGVVFINFVRGDLYADMVIKDWNNYRVGNRCLVFCFQAQKVFNGLVSYCFN